MDKRWKILSADSDLCSSLRETLKINPILCKILVQRGATTFDEAKKYFRPQLDMLYDPWLMKDMDKAVSRIMQAITYNEKILVFGDYDVDGTSSVACMTKFLREVYSPANIDFYIPHRYREGYGVSKAGIDFAYKQNYSLIISLDCGIKSIDLIGYARQLGIDFIVCDHHLPDHELPPAVAILNPKQRDCSYPFKDLCGCGVGYKLICALSKTLNLPDEYPHKYLDLVATAIAADIVSMTDENRILVHYGLKKANSNPNPGIKALMHLSGIKNEMLIGNLVFMIAPRINAAGRMDDARKAVQMFISDDYRQALQYAEMLHSDNTDRREADKMITEEALKLINNNEHWTKRKSTVVYQSHWHKGVVGIVASRLIDHYYRPTIVLTQSGEYVAGSARSVAGFNVYEAIHQCKDLLLGYGGHFYAAGMTMIAENVVLFQDRFEEVVSSIISDELLVPEIVIDAEVTLKDLTSTFYGIVSQMEPFGPDNVKPVFVVRNVVDTGYSKIVKENHLKLVIAQDNLLFGGIGFNLAYKYDELAGKQPVDVVFTLDKNEWNGNTSLQLKVVDLKRSCVTSSN
jgi:single-stranded-DNA-specific exonuclease